MIASALLIFHYRTLFSSPQKILSIIKLMVTLLNEKKQIKFKKGQINTRLRALKRHQTQLKQCTACPDMQSQPVVGQAVLSPILLIGQAPGIKEKDIQQPFAWTAGKTLFKWFATIGLDESQCRQQIYMAAVCHCFPGKNTKSGGGDRVPNLQEINHCRHWLQQEIDYLQPQLILPVGKLAISQIMTVNKLDQIIGKQYDLIYHQHPTHVIPLPHPSGVSTWHRREPGISLLNTALQLIQQHPAWQQVTKS